VNIIHKKSENIYSLTQSFISVNEWDQFFHKTIQIVI
jgi:hypothetical protein